MSAVMSTLRKPMPAELEAETAVQHASRVEILTVAIAGLLLMVVEVLGSKPRILFERYLFVDEMWAYSRIGSEHLALSRDAEAFRLQTPPLYHLLARTFWRLWGGSPEMAFRSSLS